MSYGKPNCCSGCFIEVSCDLWGCKALVHAVSITPACTVDLSYVTWWQKVRGRHGWNVGQWMWTVGNKATGWHGMLNWFTCTGLDVGGLVEHRWQRQVRCHSVWHQQDRDRIQTNPRRRLVAGNCWVTTVHVRRQRWHGNASALMHWTLHAGKWTSSDPMPVLWYTLSITCLKNISSLPLFFDTSPTTLPYALHLATCELWRNLFFMCTVGNKVRQRTEGLYSIYKKLWRWYKHWSTYFYRPAWYLVIVIFLSLAL